MRLDELLPNQARKPYSILVLAGKLVSVRGTPAKLTTAPRFNPLFLESANGAAHISIMLSKQFLLALVIASSLFNVVIGQDNDSGRGNRGRKGGGNNGGKKDNKGGNNSSNDDNGNDNGGNNNNNNGNNNDDLQLDPNNVQDGSAKDGNAKEEEGQAASLTYVLSWLLWTIRVR